MGLDQYAYTATQSDDTRNSRQIAYWRKHPNLQGWMQNLWISKGYPNLPVGGTKFATPFNGIELELFWEDIDALEKAVIGGQLPDTQGFFFGNPSDEYYRSQDLEFVKNARAELFLGLKVFYNSSW